jgi:hypothetical protein
MAVWEHTPSTERLLEIEGEIRPDCRLEVGMKSLGGGGEHPVWVSEASFLYFCPFEIQGVHQYNEAGPLIYHLFGNVIAFLAPCVFFVIGLHSSTVRSTLKTSLLNSFISYSIP